MLFCSEMGGSWAACLLQLVLLPPCIEGRHARHHVQIWKSLLLRHRRSADPRGRKEKAPGWDSLLFPQHREVARSLLGCMRKLNCDIN